MTWKSLLRSDAPKHVILIRLTVGLIFLSEGLQKFMFPADVGAGRFAKIGFPNPELIATFVGINEIIFGTLVFLGLLTRLAVVPLICIMLTAIVSTKVPILIDKGFWKMAHEARTDFSMLMSCVFLLIVGAGPLSLDRRLDNAS